MSTVYSAVLPRSDGILLLPSIICQNNDVFDDHNDDEVHGTQDEYGEYDEYDSLPKTHSTQLVR